MRAFVVESGHQLSGTIKLQGIKSEVLQVICVTLPIPDLVTIKNTPDVLDVNNLVKLIQEIDVKVVRINKNDYAFQADEINLDYLGSDVFANKCSSLRDSALVIGLLLGRFGRNIIAKPGGGKIGRRRLDTHLLDFKTLGAKPRHNATRDAYHIETANELRGCYMLLDEASVTGTANIAMAAVMVEETVTVYNATCELYIQQLCHLLNAMRANISDTISNLLTVVGIELPYRAKHTALPDTTGTGSFIGIVVVIGNDVRIKDVAIRHLGIIPDTFRRLGIKIKTEGNDLLTPRQLHYQIGLFIDGTIMTLSSASWPGLTPDLLSVLLVVATQVCGCVPFHQKMFENRLFFVGKLIDMRAQITLCDPHRTVIIGHSHQSRLYVGCMANPDIRAGIVSLIAALSAEGTSRIESIAQIDRGYRDVETRLNVLSAHTKYANG